MKWLPGLLIAFALTAFAADVTGTWKGTVETPAGPRDRTFIFKVEGNKLTGETESPMLGKSVIKDGKIEGDTLSFSFTAKFQDQEVTVNYKGKVSGDEIKFTVEVPGGPALEYTAKKIS
jgi:hypothetical protein